MTIAAGTRLGPYEILAPIGAGGMGEVFRAKDTRLDRAVAIKILPPHLAADAQFKERFEREARTISQLNHPNICTLHDVGENYLVMELLEGETLADRLVRGPLALNELLRYGAEIAEALDKAHRAGIVHRDLKPGNVMLTRTGAKLLDFGLAKSRGAISFDTEGATEHKPLTREGTILGTFQYMAPEQLGGEEADARTDIFSFGAVLYEMATGKRAFEGKTRTSLIAAIVGGTPRPISELQPLTPVTLEHLIGKCLAKEPDERWQSAQDIAGELRWISTLGSQSGAAAAVARSRRRGPRLQMVVLVVTALAALALAIVSMHLAKRVALAERPLRAQFVTPADLPMAPVMAGAVSLSPDGRKIAFVSGTRFDRVAVAVRDLQSGETRALAGTAGALFLFWSPDSRKIAFFSNGKLSTISAAGGPVQIICDAPEGRGGSWNSSGMIIFTPNIAEPIFKVSEAGGNPVAVTEKKPKSTHRNPLFLPDGKTFLYVGRDGAGRGAVLAASIEGGVQRRILESASNVQYANGYLFFMRDGNLVAQRFDPESLAVSGTPIPIAEDVEFFQPRDVGNFSVSNTGVLVYRASSKTPTQFVWFDRQGKILGPAGPSGSFLSGDLSRDGRKVVAIVGDTSAADVWILQLDRGGISRVTFTNLPLLSAVMSPDGRQLAVASGGGSESSIWIQDLGGRASRTELLKSTSSLQVSGWSTDGRHIIALVQESATRFDISAIALDKEKKLIPLLGSPFDERRGTVSPDGRWLAYESNESGRVEVYVTSFPAAEGKSQISYEGGSSPRWSRDGKELFFASGGKLFSAVRSSSGEFATPVALPLPVELLAPAGLPYDVAPDGRFIILTEAGKHAPNPLQVIVNWRKELP